MADDKNLDHPDYKGTKGVWNKTFGRQDENGRGFASIAAREVFNDTLGVCTVKDKEKGEESKMWSPFMHGVVAGVLTIPIGLASMTVYQAVSPDADPSFKPIELTQTGQLQDGYSAVTLDAYHGSPRYVLFIDEGKPQLYRISSDGDQMEYVAQQQDAHETMSMVSRNLSRDHRQMQAWVNAESPDERRNIDFDTSIDTIGEASLPHTTASCDAPCVTRDITYSDVEQANDLSTIYAQKSEIWSKAAEVALTSDYGFTPEQTGNIAHDVEGGEALRLGLLYSFLGALGFTVSWASAEAIGKAAKNTSPTTSAMRRRRRKEKGKAAKPA